MICQPQKYGTTNNQHASSTKFPFGHTLDPRFKSTSAILCVTNCSVFWVSFCWGIVAYWLVLSPHYRVKVNLLHITIHLPSFVAGLGRGTLQMLIPSTYFFAPSYILYMLGHNYIIICVWVFGCMYSKITT